MAPPTKAPSKGAKKAVVKSTKGTPGRKPGDGSKRRKKRKESYSIYI